MRRIHQLNIALNDAELARVRRLAEVLGLDAVDTVRHLTKRAHDELVVSGRAEVAA